MIFMKTSSLKLVLLGEIKWFHIINLWGFIYKCESVLLLFNSGFVEKETQGKKYLEARNTEKLNENIPF